MAKSAVSIIIIDISIIESWHYLFDIANGLIAIQYGVGPHLPKCIPTTAYSVEHCIGFCSDSCSHSHFPKPPFTECH